MPNDYSKAGLLVLMGAFVLGMSIAAGGGRRLSEAQMRELSAHNPDLPGVLLLMAIAGCAWFARAHALYSVVAAVALTALWAYRMLPKFNQEGWPKDARRLLIIGNFIMCLGATSFVLITAAGAR